MKRCLAMLALCGLMMGCATESATEVDAELDAMEQQYDNPEASEAEGADASEEDSSSN